MPRREHKVVYAHRRRVVSEGLRNVGNSDRVPRRRREGGDEVDLHKRVPHQQPGRPHRGPRRGRREEFPPHLVEAVEVPQIRQEHLTLHHVRQRGTRGGEGLGEIVQDVTRLLLDGGSVVRKRGIDASFRRHSTLEIARQLPRREHQVAHPYRLGVVSQRPRGGGHHALGRAARHAGDEVDLHKRVPDQKPGGPHRGPGGGVGEEPPSDASSKPWKFLRSVWKTWALTTCSREVPAARNVRARFSRI